MLSSCCQFCATPRPGQGDRLELAELQFFLYWLLHNDLAEGGRELHPPGCDLQGAGGLLPGEPLAHQAGELRQPPRGAAEDHQVPQESRHCHMDLNDYFKTNSVKRIKDNRILEISMTWMLQMPLSKVQRGFIHFSPRLSKIVPSIQSLNVDSGPNCWCRDFRREFFIWSNTRMSQTRTMP